MKIQIQVRTFSGKIFTYTTDAYEVKDGLVRFLDHHDLKYRSVPVTDCRIEEAE
jgi:hypothetical protein